MKTKHRNLAAVSIMLLFAARLPAGDPAAAHGSNPDHGSMSAEDGRKESAPEQLEGVGIDEKTGGGIPLDLEFMDESGKAVRLKEIIAGDKPVVLTMGYLKCTMLCHLILAGVSRAVSELDWTAGREFEIVSVSIDPRETPAFARLNKQKFVELYGRPGAGAGWHFLTGDERNIKPLADALGFRYRYSEREDTYYHTAAIFIITPDGKISRYLYGVAFEPVTLRLSLLEASKGRLGTTADRIMMYCFHYDAEAGRYAPVAFNIMKLGGAVTVAALGLFLGGLWIFERRKRRKTG